MYIDNNILLLYTVIVKKNSYDGLKHRRELR